MKTLIDSMTVADWTGNVTLTDWPQYAASLYDSQLYFQLAGGQVASKTYTTPVPIQGMVSLAFNVQGMQQDREWLARIRFFDGVNSVEYYLPLPEKFNQIRFDPQNLTAISRIEIEADEDIKFYISEIIAYKDDLDSIYQSFTALLEKERGGIGLPLAGTVTAAAGDTEITVRDWNWLDEYSVIKIGSEIHAVKTIVPGPDATITLNRDYYDGAALLSDYTDEPVYLHIPVNTEPAEDLIQLPSISLNGIPGAITDERLSEELIYDSFTPSPPEGDGTCREQPGETHRTREIEVTGEARHGDHLELVERIMMRAFGKSAVLWINGQKHDANSGEFIAPDFGDATDIIGKVQCTVSVTVAEELSGTRILSSKTINIDVGAL